MFLYLVRNHKKPIYYILTKKNSNLDFQNTNSTEELNYYKKLLEHRTEYHKRHKKFWFDDK
jgi:hypothetical protein